MANKQLLRMARKSIKLRVFPGRLNIAYSRAHNTKDVLCRLYHSLDMCSFWEFNLSRLLGELYSVLRAYAEREITAREAEAAWLDRRGRTVRVIDRLLAEEVKDG